MARAGGENGRKGLEIPSDGSMDTLRVACDIHKTIMGQPLPGSVRIWNLAPNTRQAIRSGLTKIVVRAGWSNTQMTRIFQGTVMNFSHTRTGVNNVTELEVMPGFGALVQGVTSRTFGSGMSVRDMVLLTAKDLPGVTVEENRLHGLNGTVSAAGWSFAGSTREALDQQAREYGFSWSVQDGIFQALADNTCLPGPVLELDGDSGGLIGISPQQSDSTQTRRGVSVQAIFTPGLLPGRRIQVKSRHSEGLNGLYRVNRLACRLDTGSTEWNMNLDCTGGF